MKNMTFKELLDLTTKNKVSIEDLEIAKEVEFHFDETGEDYERLCKKVKDCCSYTNELSVGIITSSLAYFVDERGLEDALKTNEYIILEYGKEYINYKGV